MPPRESSASSSSIGTSVESRSTAPIVDPAEETVPPQPPAVPPDGPNVPPGQAPLDKGRLSQWQLIRLKFARHKLAVISFYFLIILYSTALLAPFFAPYSQTWRDVDYGYSPPMIPQFSFSEGLHTPLLEKKIHPVTLKQYYEAHPEEVVPLGFFVRGEPYQLLGLIHSDVHFFGVDNSRLGPQWEGREPPRFYLLGADGFGHDILSRLVIGSRISLSIGLVAIAINFCLGILMGGISGYYGGVLDNLIQRTIEILDSFPHIPLWLALAAVIPITWSPLQTYFAITILLSLLTWTRLARVVRGKILSLREEDYAVAARLLGASHGRIILRHLVPGFTSHIIVALTLSIPHAIIGETALSFLGLGLRPPVVSWGVILQDCINMQVVANYPWLLTPVIMITVTVLAFNFLGDGLRDAADPYA